MKELKLALEAYEDLFHDIKNTMSVISAYIQLLEQNINLCDPSLEYVLSIKRSWLSMFHLINDANDHSKMHRGDLNPAFRNCEIIALLEEIARTSSLVAQKKDIKLTFTSDVRKKVMAVDQTLLERIMLNLLSNAIKFTDRFGRIEMMFRNGLDKVSLVVKDNGIGIPEGEIEGIMERYQCSKGEGNEFGSGIGLSIVNESVKLLRGEIHVSSGCAGTEMTVELPVFVMEEEMKEEEPVCEIDDFYHDMIEQIELSDISALGV